MSPRKPVEVFNTGTVVALSGITYRQLQYWTLTGLLKSLGSATPTRRGWHGYPLQELFLAYVVGQFVRYRKSKLYQKLLRPYTTQWFHGRGIKQLRSLIQKARDLREFSHLVWSKDGWLLCQGTSLSCDVGGRKHLYIRLDPVWSTLSKGG